MSPCCRAEYGGYAVMSSRLLPNRRQKICPFGQGCSLSLKRLGREAFFEHLGLVLILSLQCLGLSLETRTSRYRLGLDIICLIYTELQSSDL